MKEKKLLIFMKTRDSYSKRQGEENAYIRYDCKPLENLKQAQEKIKEICLNSEYKLSDFRIFEEYPAK